MLPLWLVTLLVLLFVGPLVLGMLFDEPAVDVEESFLTALLVAAALAATIVGYWPRSR